MHCSLVARSSAVKLAVRKPQSLTTYVRTECRATVARDRVLCWEITHGVSRGSTKLELSGRGPDKDSARLR